MAAVAHRRTRTAQIWPTSGFHNVKFYLCEGGNLTAIRPSCPAASRYEDQPEKHVPTIGGNIDSGKQLVRRGAQNQVLRRSDFLAGDRLPLLA